MPAAVPEHGAYVVLDFAHGCHWRSYIWMIGVPSVVSVLRRNSARLRIMSDMNEDVLVFCGLCLISVSKSDSET